jgi:hypothetical protein
MAGIFVFLKVGRLKKAGFATVSPPRENNTRRKRFLSECLAVKTARYDGKGCLRNLRKPAQVGFAKWCRDFNRRAKELLLF